MSEAITVKTKEAVRSVLALDGSDEYFNDVLRALNFDNLSEFTEEQISSIEKYIYLEQNKLLDYLEEKIKDLGGAREEAIRSVYAERGGTEKKEAENSPETEAESTPEDGEKTAPKKPRRKTPRGGGKSTLKSLMEEIGKTIERPVKLNQMAEILEIAGLEVEEEYGEEDRLAIDKALPRYLARELSRKEAGSSDGDIGTALDRDLSNEVERLTEKIAGTVASAREGLEETIEREVPRRMMAQLAAIAKSGVLGEKIELARQKIAEQKRIEGATTTIDVTIAGVESKQLPSADAGDNRNGAKGG
jgi:hypothetical protein